MKDTLGSISVLDGRYRKYTEPLADIFSEYGLIRHRVLVEVRWLQFLIDDLGLVSGANPADLEPIVSGFNRESATMVKTIEKKTNHDVKAVEYYIKTKLDTMGLSSIGEFVHFGCTSEDINNTAYALMIRRARDLLCETVDTVHTKLADMGEKWAAVPMMSRTHGQPASPTTVGKEFCNFSWRIHRETTQLRMSPVEAKMNGASGNFNAHRVAFPDVDWPAASQRFLTNVLAVTPLLWTTQINPYHYISQQLHTMIRICATVIDCDRDMWGYISLNYFTQKLNDGEVGSSTMPHKVNPINFENSEGNMGVAVSMMEHLARKLLNSRFQRDLTDSTVLRNLGAVFGYIFIGLKNLMTGLSKIAVNEDRIIGDLAAHPELLAEAVQTVMRARGETDPYEKMKSLTRGKQITMKDIIDFIGTLDRVPAEEKARLRAMTPETYTGYAEELAKRYVKGVK